MKLKASVRAPFLFRSTIFATRKLFKYCQLLSLTVYKSIAASRTWVYIYMHIRYGIYSIKNTHNDIVCDIILMLIKSPFVFKQCLIAIIGAGDIGLCGHGKVFNC